MRKRATKYGLEKDARGIWQCDFSVAGRRLQRSTYTADRQAAQEWCSALASRTWREIKLGEKPSLKWEEGVEDWFADKKNDGKRDLANDRDKAVILGAKLDGHVMHELHTSPEDSKGVNVNAILDELQRERGWTNSTRNRHRSFIVGVTNHTRAKGYNVPALTIARRREQRKEARALTREEADTFLAALPLHLSRPARFSLACGMRQSNVTGLRWFKERYGEAGKIVPHVTEDLRHMVVPASHSKSGKMLRIPLNADARRVLREARGCKLHGHKTFAFTYHGQPIEQPYNTAFIRVARAQGLDGLNWHSFRHTWTTWHLEQGTPMEVVKELGGWSSLHVLQKHYNHIRPAHVERYADNVSLEQRPTAVARIGRVA